MTTDEPRQIIAIGGLSPDSAPLLFAYLVEQTGLRRPRVGFLPTASGDAESHLERFYALFGDLACEPAHLGLFGRVGEPEAFIRGQDLILVGGGNTKSMLGLWKEWQLDRLLGEAWQAGTVLAGFSAGAICWFEHALCDAWAEALRPIPGLGLLPGSCCPHFDGEPQRRPAYLEQVGSGAIPAGIAIDDDCAVHVRGTVASSIVTTRAEAGAYRVAPSAGSAEATPLELPTRILSGG